jgi:predicted RNA-binding protein YlxR (DUF448 family)
MSDKKTIRTCVGCNKKEEKNKLIRIIQQNGELVIDHKNLLRFQGRKPA